MAIEVAGLAVMGGAKLFVSALASVLSPKLGIIVPNIDPTILPFTIEPH